MVALLPISAPLSNLFSSPIFAPAETIVPNPNEFLLPIVMRPPCRPAYITPTSKYVPIS